MTQVLILVGWITVLCAMNWISDRTNKAAHACGYTEALMQLAEAWDTSDHWEEVRRLQDAYEAAHPRNKIVERFVDWVLARRARRAARRLGR